MTANRPLLEIAVDDLDAARRAEEAGADRLELCTGLDVDGLTPGPELLAAVLDAVAIPVCVLVRPRPGGFVYREGEDELYVAECRRVAQAPVEALVIGALTVEGELDEELLGRLVDASFPRPLVFHRAFDLVPDRVRARQVLADLGFARILTSGGSSRAVDALELLRKEATLDGPRLVLGGGVRASNAAPLAAGASWDLHSSARNASSALEAPGRRGPSLSSAPSPVFDPAEARALARLLHPDPE